MQTSSPSPYPASSDTSDAPMHRALGRVQRARGVWGAVALLRADRVDHGVRAIEDPAPVRMLANRQIALFGWTDDTMRAVALAGRHWA